MNSRCVVVIGHVDHGKTALVRALSGIETDRLPEEKARGLSITPGFAHCTYPDGVIDFVDAPGHADFIQAMVAGASGAQAALIVISLADGLGAQTYEHLRIAQLLGITEAVIALSKSDLVTPEDQPTRLSALRAALSETPFGEAPLVMCSAQSGDGMDTLQGALKDLLKRAPWRSDARQSYLPIDRAFSLPGRGTIVTGTLLGEDLSQDADMVAQPAGHAVSLRSLQSRGQERETIRAGERMAANLRGIGAEAIPRGSVLCAPGMGEPSRCIDVSLEILPQSKPLKHMQDIRVLFGTTHAVAQVRLLKDHPGFAQLRFKKPIFGFEGQRAILRHLSPAETMGAATFLDTQAPPLRSRDQYRPAVLLAAQQRETKALVKALIAAGKGCAPLSEIARLARQSVQDARDLLDASVVALDKDHVTTRADVAAAQSAMLDALAAYHLHHPLRAMAPRATLENIGVAPALLLYVETLAVADNQLRRKANMLALQAHDPMAQLNPDQRSSLATLEDQFRAAGLNAASPKDAEDNDLLHLLMDQGTLISLPNIALKQTLTFHTETLAQAARRLHAAFPGHPFTTSEARTALNTSRRVIVPVLEHFDSLGVTTRHNDTRRIADLNLVSPRPAP